MTGRSLKIALAASVALNLFAAGAAVTVLVNRERAEAVRQEARPQGGGRTDSPMALIGRLDAAEQERVRTQLRTSARAARPDFEAARQARRAAIAAAGSETYDPAAVAELLAASRAAEMRGRERLEADAVDLLGTVSAQDRQTLSQILARRGQGRDHRRARDREQVEAPKVE